MTRGRLLLWLALALPALWIGWQWIATPESFGFGHAIKDSGDWAAWLLLLTLAVTPLRLAFRRARWTLWLMKRRRDLGVSSFVYAAMHTAIYLVDKASFAVILEQAAGADLLTGWLALAIFLPLAITSNDRSMRAMKRGWKRLHRLVHPAAVLVFAHWALTAFDPVTAYIHIGILAAIEIAGWTLKRRPSGSRIKA